MSEESANEQPVQAAEESRHLDLSYELTRLPGSRATLAVTVSASEVGRAYRRVYRQLSESGAVRGFRPGRVPREVLRRRFGEDAVREYVLEQLQAPALQQAVTEAGIIPVAPPELDEPQLAEGQPLAFQATMAVRPDPKLGEYKGLRLRKPVTEITDEDIAQELDEMREGAGEWAESTRNKVEEGEVVALDLAVTFQDEPPEAATDVEYVVGQRQGEPRLDDALVGAVKGETQTVEAAYSESYEDEQRAGKTAQVTFTVKSIRERRPPEADDAFAEHYGFESVEALRADIRDRLAANAAEGGKTELRRQAVEQVVAASEVELPQELIGEEMRARWGSLERQAQREGIEVADLLRAAGKSEEEVEAEHREEAMTALRQAFILDAIAEAEGIEVDEVAVDAEVARIAGELPQSLPPPVVRRALEQGGELDRLRSRLRTERTVDFLIEGAEIEEVPLDDYLAAQQPSDEGESPEADA